MSGDRVTFNEVGNWEGPRYALGLVDELVLSNCTAHLEMLGDNAAYLVATSSTREVLLRLYARPTTRAERRQILAHSDDRLVDRLAGLIPVRLGGRSWWSIPWYRRPAATVREWLAARRAARAVLCVSCDEDDHLVDLAEPG